jgi:ubiquinone biosynthesis protein
MFKALITMEGLGRQYDPEFHIIEHLAPLLRQVLRERYRPDELVGRGRSALEEFLNVVGSVPRDIARLTRDARRGKARIDLDIRRLDSFGDQLDKTLDRVTMGIMTASLVIGSSIVMTVSGGPTVLGIPLLVVIGFAGYAVAFVNSIWVIYGIWRQSKR